MATTVQNILDRAIQRSALNNPDLVPNAQVVSYCTLLERAVYSFAGQLNPDYFGVDAGTAVRAAFTDSWDLNVTPGNVAVVTRAEVKTIAGAPGVAVGDKVNLVGLKWKEVDLPPRAYIRNRKIYGVGTELGASTPAMVTALQIYYSPVPTALTLLSSTLTLPDEWTTLVELPLAKILALRDRRMDEIAGIDAEYKMAMELFQGAVTAFDSGARRPVVAISANQAPVSGK
jgi:hypothetical protein